VTLKKYILALMAIVVLALSAGPSFAQLYMLESTNFPGMYIRHFNFKAVLSRVENAQDKKDAAFWIRPGLTGFEGSYESYNFPGLYLRHQNFQLVLSKKEGNKQFRQDATFHGTKQPNGGYLLESVNFPGFFIRHKNFKIVLEKNDGTAQFLADASFRLQGAGAIDENPPPPDNDDPKPPPGKQATAAVDTTIFDKPAGEDVAYLSQGDPVTIVECNADDFCQISEPQAGWVWGPDLNR